MLTWSASANSSLTQSPAFSPSTDEVGAEERHVQVVLLGVDGPVGEDHRDAGVPGLDEHGVPAGLDDRGEGDDVDALLDELADRLDLVLLLALGVGERSGRLRASAAASWIDFVLAVRQPLSAPTWAKPIVYPLRSGISIGRPASAVAAGAAVVAGGGARRRRRRRRRSAAALASVSANANAVTLFFNTAMVSIRLLATLAALMRRHAGRFARTASSLHRDVPTRPQRLPDVDRGSSDPWHRLLTLTGAASQAT